LTRIQLSGTHTFDGKVAYRFGVPFTALQHKATGSIAAGTATVVPAGIHLFFKLQGDINNYKISHEAKATKESLQKVFKEQGRIIDSLARGAYQKKRQPQELAPDDYFEFDK
jgi:hypothetical protein